jgi:hypothetical protein
MKTVLLALAVAVPALAFADDPAPYVLHNGRAAPARASGGRASGTRRAAGGKLSAPRPRGASGARRGLLGTAPVKNGAAGSGSGGGSGNGSSSNAPVQGPAVPGATILSAGVQPTVSDPGAHGVNPTTRGGVITLDPARAQDVGRSPGLAWGTPDASSARGRAGGNAVTPNSPGGGSPSPITTPQTSPPVVFDPSF